MLAEPDGIRPEIVALKERIVETSSQPGAHRLALRSGGLLARGPNAETAPTGLIQSKELLPAEKIIWLVLASLTRDAEFGVKLPSLQKIGRLANMRSRVSVSNAIAVLRCQRWLTVSSEISGSSGVRWSGAYLLHSTPLSFPDAHWLDPDYSEFLKRASAAHRARVVAVAGKILGEAAKQGLSIPENNHLDDQASKY